MTRAIAALLTAGLALGLISVGGPTAEAQQTTPVVGTADFRNPPVLVPGQYTDTIVTGETVWYAIVYRNGAPYRFEASVPGVDLAAEGLDLETSFVGPTLETVRSGSGLAAGSGAHYDKGHTNIWYVTVTLDTATVLGVPYRFTLDIDGAETTTLADCADLPDCSYDEELAVIRADLAQVSSDLGAIDDLDAADIVDGDIARLEGSLEAAQTVLPQAEARFVAAQNRLAALCADPECEVLDAGTRTPLWAWPASLLVLGLGTRRGMSKIRKAVEAEAEGGADGENAPS